MAALAADAYVYGFPLIFDLPAVGGDVARWAAGRPGPRPDPSRWSRRKMKSDAPDEARVIEFPTDVATIVGRWACDGRLT